MLLWEASAPFTSSSYVSMNRARRSSRFFFKPLPILLIPDAPLAIHHDSLLELDFAVDAEYLNVFDFGFQFQSFPAPSLAGALSIEEQQIASRLQMSDRRSRLLLRLHVHDGCTY